MNIEGEWIGYYEYGSGYELPFFGSRVEIEVTFSVDLNKNITGVIFEKPSKFSVNSKATIKGFIDESLISFVKSYPFCPQINYENNIIEITKGKLEIDHSGYIDNQNQAIYGEWMIEEKFTDEDGYDNFEFINGIWLLKRK